MPRLKMVIVAKLSCLKMVVMEKACLKLVIVAKLSCLKKVILSKNGNFKTRDFSPILKRALRNKIR